MLAAPYASFAATTGRLVLEPAAGIQAGDEFAAALRITADESINALEGALVFDPAFVEVVTIQSARSIVPLWLEMPQNNEIVDVNRAGRLAFAGIVPGGIEGLRDDEALFVIFRAKAAGNTNIAFAEGLFYLNDGTGTAHQVQPMNYAIEIATSTRAMRTIQGSDNEPPPPFTVTRARSKDIFDGQWFIAFDARDGETGIDRYYVAECASCSLEDADTIEWHEAASPYLLRDQLSSHTVFVKAVDRAGNERVITLPPQHAGATTRLILALILLLGVATAIAYARNLRRHHNHA